MQAVELLGCALGSDDNLGKQETLNHLIRIEKNSKLLAQLADELIKQAGTQ
jgi:hypothetical protein